MEIVDCLVIGGGVIGAAVARELAVRGREVLLAERHGRFGTETSARSSEVIHAGLYYPPGSLKALTCVRGRGLLYAWCEAHGVAHRRLGKLVVATSAAQRPGLEAIADTAARNGVEDLRWLDAAQARALEPEVRCEAALWSPSTGIVDAGGLVLSLVGDLEAHGGTSALNVEIDRIEVGAAGGARVFVLDADDAVLTARWVINAAGLSAPALAARMEGFPAVHVPRAWYAKGNYFRLSGAPPFRHLVYPLPEPGGLGVHVTLDLAGQARFGPDVEWVDQPGYEVDVSRAPAFEAAIRRWWPGLRDGALAPDTAGVRPKIVGPGEPAADFRIDGPAVHGVPGVVQLFGIESPGITASLAIAEHVADIVGTASS